MINSLNDRDIRPVDLMETYQKLYQKDMAILKKGKLVKVNCPACNSSNYKIRHSKMRFSFVSCTKCNTVFVNPRPTEMALEHFYTSTKSSEFWDTIFKKTKDVRIERIFKPRIKLVREILEKYGIKKCEKMVEVGSGYGWFCELAKEKNLAQKIIAIEPSPKSAAVCRKIEGIEVVESTIEKCPQLLQSNLIVTFESVHLLFDPGSFLRACYDGLKKGGLLVFSLTNYYGFDIQILQEKSNYIIPTFLSLFNPYSIELLLKSIGFKNMDVITPGLMDVRIVLNKIKSGDVDTGEHPFFKLVVDLNNDSFVDDLQLLLQKHKMSSHMVVAAQK